LTLLRFEGSVLKKIGLPPILLLIAAVIAAGLSLRTGRNPAILIFITLSCFAVILSEIIEHIQNGTIHSLYGVFTWEQADYPVAYWVTLTFWIAVDMAFGIVSILLIVHYV
jgi:hypothetical protein